MASVSSCVQEVEIDRLCVVQLPRPKNCLQLYTHEAHKYLAAEFWPPLPIIITNVFNPYVPMDHDFDVVIMHPNRVREISFVNETRSLLQRLASANWMQEQFPVLTHLTLVRTRRCLGPAPVLPDGFLGGSAPRLQSLRLTSILFPALPKLLLSATHLVRLVLRDIPHSGYISPEVIVTGLAMLVNLECLVIGFESPLSRPERKNRSPSPPTLTVLPALTRYEFKGASEYLEDFVARIDAPLLNSISITFFHQVVFDLPRLAQFMGRISGITRFQELKEAHLLFAHGDACVNILPPATRTTDESSMSCNLRVMEWRHSSESSLAHAFTSFFPSMYSIWWTTSTSTSLNFTINGNSTQTSSTYNGLGIG